MRILSLLLLTIFLKAVKAKQQDLESAVIEYTANSRGFYQKITVQNQMVTFQKIEADKTSRGYKNSIRRLGRSKLFQKWN
jgi:hypothetical protein